MWKTTFIDLKNHELTTKLGDFLIWKVQLMLNEKEAD